MSEEEWKSFCEKISEMGKYLEGEGMPLSLTGIVFFNSIGEVMTVSLSIFLL